MNMSSNNLALRSPRKNGGPQSTMFSDVESGTATTSEAQEGAPLLSKPKTVVEEAPPFKSATSSMGTPLVILAWYTSNIGILLLNKYLLSNYGFKKPVFLTLVHMATCSAMGHFVGAVGLVANQPIKSRQQLYKIVVLAAVFCLSVVLGNVALRFIPVSFSQAIGATTPFFTAILAIFMLGSRETAEVYLALVPVVVGIVIATGAEPLFDMTGFLAAVAATAARAFKSVLQGLMLSDPSEKMNSMNLLRYMSPVSALLLLPLVFAFEPDSITLTLELGAKHSWFWPMLLLNACSSYFVNLTNFLVTKYTSALTLQVRGAPALQA